MHTIKDQVVTIPYHGLNHGYYQVDLALIRKLKIRKQISQCSYIDGKVAYLEEDCDAPIFFHACKINGINIKVVDVGSSRYKYDIQDCKSF